MSNCLLRNKENTGIMDRGVARNLLRGDKPGDLGDRSPSRVQAQGGHVPMSPLCLRPWLWTILIDVVLWDFLCCLWV